MFMHIRMPLVLGVALMMALCVPAARGQADPQVRVVMKGDSAYVYHTELLPPGYGVNLYRIEGSGEAVLVSEEPATAVQTGEEFAVAVGERFEAIRQNLDATTPFEVLMRLRGDRTLGLLTTFAYPDVARAFGRLVVDGDAPIGRDVTYRFEIVDDFREPTGDTIEGRARLTELRPPLPSQLSADHEGNVVTLSWQYPTTREDDGIIRFNVYRETAAGPEVLSDDIILLRNAAESEFEFQFSVPEVGVTETLRVAAVAVTGEEFLGEPIEYFVRDNIPPAPPVGVTALPIDADASVELSWRVSPEPDVVGYHVYRAPRLEAEFTRLTDEPLDAFDNVYHDTTTIGRRTYFYQVSAIDASGNESARTNPLMAQVSDFEPPPSPENLEATFETDNQVRLSWSVASVAPDLETYVILRRRLDGRRGIGYEQVNKEAVTRTEYRDRGVENPDDPAAIGFAEGAFYRYGVVAADSARNFSDTVFVDIQIPDRTPPPPPGNLVAVNDAGLRAVVRWTASNAGDVTEYVIHRRIGGGEGEAFARVSASTLVLQDDSVRVGTTYHYYATAVDSVGNESAPSAEAELHMRSFDPPPVVRNVQAFRQGADVVVRWERSPASDLAGYNVYRSNMATGTYQRVNTGLLTGTQTTLFDSDELPFIQVRAVDTSGNESRASRPARVVEQR